MRPEPLLLQIGCFGHIDRRIEAAELGQVSKGSFDRISKNGWRLWNNFLCHWPGWGNRAKAMHERLTAIAAYVLPPSIAGCLVTRVIPLPAALQTCA